MLKLISSIIGGLVIAFAIVFVTDAIFHALSSSATQPANPNNPAAMGEYVSGQPISVLSGLVFGWALAAFVGSAIASRFGMRGEWPGWVVTLLFLMATGANFLMVQHPTWMVLVAVIGIVVAGWLGSRIGSKAKKPARSQFGQKPTS